MKQFCLKTKAMGYAIFEVGHSKKERRRWRNRWFSRFLVMTSAVYSSYFRGYRSAPKPRLGVYKGLKYLCLGVSLYVKANGRVGAILT